jgi:hypothetical protein
MSLRLSIQTIYDVLDEMRKRPGMYFGRPGTIALLDAVLLGRSLFTLQPEDPPLQDFRTWFAVRNEAIRPGIRDTSEKLALDRTFPPTIGTPCCVCLEYRSTRVELLCESRGPFVARFTVGFEQQIPEQPGRIVVGRFAPGHIHFWATETGAVLEKGIPFCRSVQQAQKLARERWKIPARSWRTLDIGGVVPKVRQERKSAARGTGIDLLERIRERPGMYIGEDPKPLTPVQDMLHGYEWALDAHGLADPA